MCVLDHRDLPFIVSTPGNKVCKPPSADPIYGKAPRTLLASLRGPREFAISLEKFLRDFRQHLREAPPLAGIASLT